MVLVMRTFSVIVTFRKTALKALAAMQAERARRIMDTLAQVAADPARKNNNLKPLVGIPSGYRLRIGDWRVSFTLDRTARVIDVFEVAPRGGAYRWRDH